MNHEVFLHHETYPRRHSQCHFL